MGLILLCFNASPRGVGVFFFSIVLTLCCHFVCIMDGRDEDRRTGRWIQYIFELQVLNEFF